MHKEIQIVAFNLKKTSNLGFVAVNIKKKKKKKPEIVPLSLYGQSNSLRITMYTPTLRGGSSAPLCLFFLVSWHF